MFEQVGMLIIALIVLGVLIVVHELGHFLVAKVCGVGVLEFSIGFGRKICRRKFGETYYNLGLIPLGGYVRMVGDDPFSEQQDGAPEGQDGASSLGRGEAAIRGDDSWMDESDKALLANRERWFSRKSFWARTAIVLAGPLANFVFSVLLAIASYYGYGAPVPDMSPRIGDVTPDYPAEKAGIKPGDLVKAIDGKPVKSWIHLHRIVVRSEGKELDFLIERPGAGDDPARDLAIKISGVRDTEEYKVISELAGVRLSSKAYRIGIAPQMIREKVPFYEAVVSGTAQAWWVGALTIKVLKALVVGKLEPGNVVGGPIAVFSGAARSARKGGEALIDFMVMLGVSLAIFNLLPIPILDGGHIMFFVIEAVMRRPLSIRARAMANQFGMAVLILLMAFAFSNDIIRLL